ncbi:MAG: hypothetical protein ACRCWI_01990 [Brevinema sp.]
MWEKFKKSIPKKEIYYFIALIIFFTGITTALIIALLIEKQRICSYTFLPNFKISKIIFRDRINSEEKLKAVLQDRTIIKEFSPGIGDFIIKEDSRLVLSSGEEVLRKFEIYPLPYEHNIKGEGYQFISNVITISKIPVLVEKITTEILLNKIKKDKDIVIIGYTNLQLGAFIWKTPQGYYYIFKDTNFSKEHLYNPQLSELVNIKEIIHQQ